MTIYRGYLGLSYVASDWIVIVFGSYGIIDRPSGHLSMWDRSSIWVHVQTLPLNILFFSIITGILQENMREDASLE